MAGAQAGMQAEQMSKDVAAARDAQIRADLARQADLATMRNKELGGLLVDGGKIAAGIPPTPKPA